MEVGLQAPKHMRAYIDRQVIYAHMQAHTYLPDEHICKHQTHTYTYICIYTRIHKTHVSLRHIYTNTRQMISYFSVPS